MLSAHSFKFTLSVQVSDESTCNSSVNLELVTENGSCNHKDLGDLVAKFIVSLFVEEDFVVKLVLDLDLGP